MANAVPAVHELPCTAHHTFVPSDTTVRTACSRVVAPAVVASPAVDVEVDTAVLEYTMAATLLDATLSAEPAVVA